MYQCFMVCVLFAVLLDAPDTVLIERVMGKRIDTDTGGQYQLLSIKNNRKT